MLHLQEEGCTANTLACKQIMYHTCMYHLLPEDEPSVSQCIEISNPQNFLLRLKQWETSDK